MTVYVVWIMDLGKDFSEFDGVFGTREAAEAHAVKRAASLARWQRVCNHWIVACDVDKPRFADNLSDFPSPTVPAMKLWRITQDEIDDYEVIVSAIVAAPTQDAARSMHPETGESITWPRDNDGSSYKAWATTPDHVQVTYLGEAAPGTPAGVLMWEMDNRPI